MRGDRISLAHLDPCYLTQANRCWIQLLRFTASVWPRFLRHAQRIRHAATSFWTERAQGSRSPSMRQASCARRYSSATCPAESNDNCACNSRTCSWVNGGPNIKQSPYWQIHWAESKSLVRRTHCKFLNRNASRVFATAQLGPFTLPTVSVTLDWTGLTGWIPARCAAQATVTNTHRIGEFQWGRVSEAIYNALTNGRLCYGFRMQHIGFDWRTTSSTWSDHAASPTANSMESFGSRPETPISTCLEEVRQSDILIVIIGQRYGTFALIWELSFSHAEYEQAFSLG